MDITRYRLQNVNVEVDAIQLSIKNLNFVRDWVDGTKILRTKKIGDYEFKAFRFLECQTNKGQKHARVGHWLVKDKFGTVYIFTPKAFNRDFREVQY